MQHTKFPFRLPNKIELLYLGEFTDEVLSHALSNKFFSRSTLRIYSGLRREEVLIHSLALWSISRNVCAIFGSRHKHTTVHLWRVPTSLPPRCVSSARGVNRCAQVFSVSQVDYALYDHT